MDEPFAKKTTRGLVKAGNRQVAETHIIDRNHSAAAFPFAAI
jgi:hypothetical protein